MTLQQQIANAIMRGDDTFTVPLDVRLPKPQGSGTNTQRQTYALMQANQILNSITT